MHILSIIAQTHITGDRKATHKRCIRGEQIGDMKYGSAVFCVSCLPMLRGRPRTSFDQVSEFGRGGIVTYKVCGLYIPFTEISRHVGRNQATVMLICRRWMQEETTDRRGRSHPPRCTTHRDDRWIARMAVMDRAAISQTITLQIQSVTHHSVSALTIRRCLQQSAMSARRPLLRLPLIGNHKRLRRQRRNNIGHGRRNGTILELCLLSNPASACNIMMVGFKLGDTGWEAAKLLR
ncbi:transposable element Tcb1 transposase [Trichonephila clavipes]|nr:transposable element Tcb1 transposase [Trichonephila clavipes]